MSWRSAWPSTCSAALRSAGPSRRKARRAGANAAPTGNEQSRAFNASQLSWLVDEAGGTLLVDAVYKLEELEQRWELLRRRLLDGTLPRAYLDPDFVATRIDWVLSPRKRLALHGDERAAVAAWLDAARARVASHADALMRQVWSRHISRRERISDEG